MLVFQVVFTSAKGYHSTDIDLLSMRNPLNVIMQNEMIGKGSLISLQESEDIEQSHERLFYLAV